MSVLTIVRHGQASLFAADYDRLSAIGEQQGQALGEYWARQRLVVDHVYCGPRLRHRRFAELAGESCRAAGWPFPEPVVLDDLDEFDLDGLAQHTAPRLAERDPEFAAMLAAFAESGEDPHRRRSFQRMFEVVVRHWQSADSLEGVETWPAFKSRVADAVARIRQAAERGTRSVVVTSGGVIGCTVQQALAISDQTMLELSWRIRNGALTDFVFTPERFTLDAFNMTPHLSDPALWTYA